MHVEEFKPSTDIYPVQKSNSLMVTRDIWF